MRAGPLAKTNVIETLNRQFVPVYLSIEDINETGTAPAGEKAEWLRVYRAAAEAKLSTGTVHAYALSPDGQPVDSLHVADACKGDNLLDMLKRTAERLRTAAGDTLVPPRVQSQPPAEASEPGRLTLHLVSRAEGTNPSDTSWHAFPGEDWIILDAAEQSKLLPAGPAAGQLTVGTTWEVDREVSAKILRHFYPQTENNDVTTNRIEEGTLKASVVAVEGGVARARLDGRLRMRHNFYYKDDGNVVEATLVGTLDLEQEPAPRVKAFQLATETATYAKRKFDAAVRSVRG